MEGGGSTAIARAPRRPPSGFLQGTPIFMDKTPELTDEEMVEILKAIARDGGNAAARIAAIRELRAINAGDKPVEDTVRSLYDVSNPGRIRTKAA